MVGLLKVYHWILMDAKSGDRYAPICFDMCLIFAVQCIFQHWKILAGIQRERCKKKKTKNIDACFNWVRPTHPIEIIF